MSHPEISTDVAELASLANELGEYTQKAIWGEASLTEERLNQHPPFGVQTSSGYILAARSKYAQSLVLVTQTIHEYAREAASLSIGASRAAGSYHATDAAAANRTATAGGMTAPVAGPVAPATQAPALSQVATAPPPAHVAADEAAEPTGGWCTNWAAYNAPAIYQMVRADNICAGETQVMAWRRIGQALDDQARSLSGKRDAMAQAWRGQGGASEAFLLRFDQLIASMRRTAAAAATTSSAVDKINTAIQRAQQDLNSMDQQYADKSSDWVPSFVDDAEDEINDKARRRMAAAEIDVFTAAQELPEIPRYRSPGSITAGPPHLPMTGDTGVGSGGDTSLARQIPPSPIEGVNPVMPPGAQWQPPAAGDAGPELAGVTTPPGTAGNTGPILSNVPTTPPTAVPGGGGGMPEVSAPRVPYTNIIGGGGPPFGTGPAPGMIPTPPGGGRGRAGTYGPGVTGRGTPAGGSGIDGVAGRAAGGAGGRGGAGAAGMAPVGGRGAAGSGEVEPGYGEEVWDVEQGVPGVIVPGEEKRHDPGPGYVIGMEN